MGGQGHKLVELLTREECAQVIGVSGCTIIEVADDECGLFKVDEPLQEMCNSDEGFVL